MKTDCEKAWSKWLKSKEGQHAADLTAIDSAFDTAWSAAPKIYAPYESMTIGIDSDAGRLPGIPRVYSGRLGAAYPLAR